MQGGFNIKNSINIINHISIEQKPNDHLIDAEKVFDLKLFTKQKHHRLRERTHGYQGGRGRGRDS